MCIFVCLWVRNAGSLKDIKEYMDIFFPLGTICGINFVRKSNPVTAIVHDSLINTQFLYLHNISGPLHFTHPSVLFGDI